MKEEMLKKIANKVKDEKTLIKPEAIVVLSNITDDTMRLALLIKKGSFENNPVAYIISRDKFTTEVEKHQNLTYIDGDYILEGSLKQVLAKASESGKSEKENKHIKELLAEYPGIAKLAEKESFSRKDIVEFEKHFNMHVKDFHRSHYIMK